MKKKLKEQDELIAALKSKLEQQQSQPPQQLPSPDVESKDVQSKEAPDWLKKFVIYKDQQIVELKEGYAAEKEREDKTQHEDALLNDAEMAALKQSLADAKDEIARLNADLSKDDTAFQMIRTKGLELRDKFNRQTGVLAHTKERAQLQDVLTAKQQEHIALLDQKNRLAALRQQRDRQTALVYKERLDQTASTLSAKQNEYDQNVSRLEQSIQLMDQKSARLNNAIEQKTKEKEDLYRLMDRFKDRLKETSDVTDGQYQTLAAHRAQIEKLNAELAKAQGQLRAKQLDIEAAHQQLDEAKKVAHGKKLSLGLAQATLEEKTKEQDSLAARLKEQLKSSEEQMAKLKEQLTVVEAKLKQVDHSDDLARLQDMLKSSREEVIQLNILLKDKETQVAKLQKELNVNSKEFQAQDQALKALQADVEKQQLRMGKLGEDVEWKEKEIARLKTQLKENKIDLLSPSMKAQAMPVVPTEERSRVVALTAQLKETENKLREANRINDAARLKEALKDAKEQIATLKGKLRLKQQALLKNDPDYIAMGQQVQILKENMEDLLVSQASLKNKYNDVYQALEKAKDDLQESQVKLGVFAKPEAVSDVQQNVTAE